MQRARTIFGQSTPLIFCLGLLAGTLIANVTLAQYYIHHTSAGSSAASSVSGSALGSGSGTATGTGMGLSRASGAAVGSRGTAGTGSSAGSSGGTTIQPGQAGSGGSYSYPQAKGPGASVATGAPITIGIAYVDLTGLNQLGPNYSIGDPQKQWEAVLAGWKRDHQVPVNGHDVKFVFSKFNPVDAAAQSASCTSLVQDDHAFAVVGVADFQAGTDCVTRQNHRPLLTSDGESDSLYGPDLPYLFTLGQSYTKVLENFVYWANSKHALAGHKIGIYHLNDAVTQYDVDHGVKDTLKKLGMSLTVESTTDNDQGGPNDTLAVQKFMSAGVDVAILLSSRTGFLQQAKASGYHPLYLDSDYNYGTTDFTTNNYPSEYDGTLAMTERREGEAAARIPLTPAQNACIHNYEQNSGQTPAPSQPGSHTSGEIIYILLSCDEGQLLLDALKASGPDITVSNFIRGMESIHNLKTLWYPDASFSATQHEGVTEQRTLKWSSGCVCWVATGSFAPLWAL